jgi:hypothetical protein
MAQSGYNPAMISLRKRGRLVAMLIGGALVALAAMASISLSAGSSEQPAGNLFEDATSAQRAGDIPHRAIKLAGGRIDGQSTWGVWLHGDPASGNCWSTQTITRGAPFGETYCGYPVPPAYWRLISSGSVGRKGHPKALLFFLTRSDVGRIVAVVKQGRGRPDRQIEIPTRVISAEQARKSGADTDFAYATTVFRGSIFCLRKVEVFDRTGQRVRSMRPACTGPRDPIEENFE